ncbi:MAG: ParA family protein [Dechloromonas sp.]|jgi:chromosome partitioning protein|uniref:ParA family protein n=2 Tax=Azonexus hydrophilus TaxID=418702 RepID=A0ABZ2XNS4_9RHOO|nr:ParA family protein [Azonexus hydrophilus]MBS4017361.1 ParA family protein [Dechloromonas sp.]MCA1938553.1 ParA family protein [Dechloromonas sp.]
MRIAIFNQKGGVGKTTTTLNLGAALNRSGNPPLLIDLDPQGHLSSIHGQAPLDAGQSLFAFFQDLRTLQELEVEWEHIGRLIPAHQQLIKVDSIFGKGPAILNKLRHGLDVLEEANPERHCLIDCCPYIGVLALNAIFACDCLVIPVSTDYLSLQAADHITRTLQVLEPVMKRRVPRYYLLTRFDRRRRMSEDVRNRLRERYGDEVIDTVISENVTVAESPSLNQDVFRHNASSTGAHDYRKLFNELLERGSLPVTTR